MKESKFVEQNKENWLEFENNLRYKKNKASGLDRLFVQITDDLSYSRAFYKNRSVKIYLNGIAQILFNDLYRNKTLHFRNFIHFWKIDLPLQLHEARTEFRISFFIFLLSFGIGILSSMYDKDFTRLILGKEYVEMTLENIKNNDPMGVYKKAHETSMFASITINNLSVALATFVMGIFFSVGTILSLIHNAIMVGGFQYFFIEKGLFKESFLTIWQHGTLEISCIIIAGAAGIALGKGLLFPGTYSRIDAFKISALRGLKIFTGITPVIVLAAFIEGFITRHTEVSMIVRIVVIALSLGFILFYFVWYPWHLSHSYPNKESHHDYLRYTVSSTNNLSNILSSEEILGNVISFAKKNISWGIKIIFGIAIFQAFIALIFEAYTGYFSTTVETHTWLTFFNINNNIWQFITGILTLSFLQCITVLKITIYLNPERTLKQSLQKSQLKQLIVSAIIISVATLFPFLFGAFWGILGLMVAGPLLFLVLFYSYTSDVSFFASFPLVYEILDHSWSKLFWNSLKISGFLSMVYVLMNTKFAWQNIEAIYMNLQYDDEMMHLIDVFVLTFVGALFVVLFYFLQLSSAAFGYFTFKETVFADHLQKRIECIGERNSLFGFEKE